MARKIFLRWQDDSFLSKNGTILPYDKLEHAILGFLGMILSRYLLNVDGLQMFALLWLIWNLIGIIWEIYQLLAIKHLIQLKDIAANNIGFLLAVFFY
jgi:VanZ family protein